MTGTARKLSEADRLLSAARLLLANAVSCVELHHGRDVASNGLPGWLADCKRDVEAAAASPADAGLLEEAMKVLESAAQKLRACRGTCSSYAGLGPIVRDIDAVLARAKGATHG